MAFDALYDGYRRIRKSLLVGTLSLSSLVLATLAWVEWEEFLHPGPRQSRRPGLAVVRLRNAPAAEGHDLQHGCRDLPGPRHRPLAALGGALASAAVSTLELMQEARARPFPYYLCVHCRLLIAYESCAGPCPQCHSRIDCLEILDAEETAIAEAALD